MSFNLTGKHKTLSHGLIKGTINNKDMEDSCLQKNNVVTIATKVKREDRIKLEAVAKSLGMKNLYQLFQGLLLFLLRYFDSHCAISIEHQKMVQSYLSLVETLKGSFTPIQATSQPIYTIKKGILFVERRRGERPQMISVGIGDNGAMTESYNTNEILADVMASIDPKLLDDLNSERGQIGVIGIIDTLRSLLEANRDERMHEEINKMFTDEIDEMFEDLSIETFEQIADTQYKRKHAKSVDGSGTTGNYIPEAAKSKSNQCFRW